MPPQQPDRLLDVIDDLLDFGAHCHSLAFGEAHVAARAPLRKRLHSPPFTRGRQPLGCAPQTGARQARDDVTDRLHGTWKLVSAVREEIPSGATSTMFGEKPQGVLNYSPEGRMLALIAHGDRKPAADGRATPAEAEALYRSMLSYGGDYSVADEVVTHRVDISWNEKFTGGEQKRHFKLEGNRLTLSTPQSPDPIDGKISVRRLVWEKI